MVDEVNIRPKIAINYGRQTEAVSLIVPLEAAKSPDSYEPFGFKQLVGGSYQFLNYFLALELTCRHLMQFRCNSSFAGTTTRRSGTGLSVPGTEKQKKLLPSISNRPPTSINCSDYAKTKQKTTSIPLVMGSLG